MALRLPWVALAAVLCMYGIEQWAQSQNPIFVTHQTLTNYATGIVILIALGAQMIKGVPIFTGYPKVGWVIISLFLLSLLSLTWSIYPDGTLEQWKRHGPYVVMVIGLCPLLINEPRDLHRGLLATMVIGAVVLLMLWTMSEMTSRFIQLKSGTGIGNLEGKGNPLAIATLAGHVVLLAVLLNFRGLGRVLQVARWFIVCMGLIMSVLSGSRGQLFALVTALLVFLPMSRRVSNIKNTAVVVFSIMMLGALALWVHDTYATENRWEWDNMVASYSEGRMGSSAKLMEHWADSSPVHWVLGLGSSASFHPEVLGFYPHVVMVEVLAEEGIIGFVLLWTVVILTFRSAARVYPHVQPHDDARGLLAAICALFLFEVILSFKQGSMLLNTFAFAFAIIFGRFELGVLRHLSVPAEVPPHPEVAPQNRAPATT